MKVCVCLSIGRHPVSGRRRMAASDRVALELAVGSGAEVTGLHAGGVFEPEHERVLREYLGMGLRRLDVIKAQDRDAVEAAARVLLAHTPDIVVCGGQTEASEGTGLFPYLLAERLGWPVLPRIGAISFEGARLSLLQIEKGGRRRVRTGSAPAVLVVAPGAVHPRLSSLAASRSGEIRRLTSDAPTLAAPPIELRPARRRGARLRPGRNKVAPAAQLQVGLTPNEAARAIIDFLRDEGHLAHAATSQTTEKTSDA